MKALLKRFGHNQSGAAMVEYALLVGLVALVAIIGLASVGTELGGQFAKISCKIANPSAACTP